MKKLITLLLISISSVCIAQDTLVAQGARYGFGIIPSIKKDIYGVAFGPLGSESFCNVRGIKSSHGLNVQLLGQGFFIPLTYKHAYKHEFLSGIEYNPSHFKARHNGLMMALFGTRTDLINGISASAWCSVGYRINGISLNALMNIYKISNGLSIGLYNDAHIARGLQIGIINKCDKLSGLQFGLWNSSKKRSLPILNWGS